MTLSLRQQIIIHWSSFALLFSGIIAGIFALQKPRLSPQDDILSLEAYQRQENQERLQVNLFQYLPSFGFGNLIADWQYLRFIQYFGDTTAREAVGYSLSPDYFQSVANRDPRFVDALLKLEAATTIFAGEPQKSIASLDYSLARIDPQQTVFSYPPFYLWIYKGINELLFLGNPQAASQSYAKAIDWAKQIDPDGNQRTIQNLQGTIDFLAQNPKSKVPQIGAWSMVLSGTSDPRTQQRAIAEIQALGGIVTATEDGRLTIQVPDHIK
jgi:hypothetical protein